MSSHANEVIKFYDDFADKYDETVLNEKDYTAFEKIPAWLGKHLKKSSSLLDLGCGTGLGSRFFIEAGHQVTGVDISPKMIESARKWAYHQLICQSLEEPLGFPDHHFDAVLMLGVMEFIVDPRRLFQEIARLLKPKGLFGLTIPKKLSSDKESILGIFSFSLPQMENEFLNAGFSILQSQQFQGFKYLDHTVPYCGYLLKKTSA